MSYPPPYHDAMPEDISIDEIAWLRANSPAWRLLRAENARSCSASRTVCSCRPHRAR
jgi:hypothetical protein